MTSVVASSIDLNVTTCGTFAGMAGGSPMSAGATRLPCSSANPWTNSILSIGSIDRYVQVL